jgi:hypothetical protein
VSSASGDVAAAAGTAGARCVSGGAHRLHKSPWSYLIHIRPAWLLSKSAKPTRTVRQEISAEQEQRTQGRATDSNGTTGRHPRPCVRRLHHSCFFPGALRCHRNVLIWIFAAALNVCSRVLPVACILSQIASRSRTRPVCCRDALLSQESTAELCCGVMTVKSSRLFNLALPARKAFSLAYALQRAAFAALSKW